MSVKFSFKIKFPHNTNSTKPLLSIVSDEICYSCLTSALHFVKDASYADSDITNKYFCF